MTLKFLKIFFICFLIIFLDLVYISFLLILINIKISNKLLMTFNSITPKFIVILIYTFTFYAIFFKIKNVKII